MFTFSIPSSSDELVTQSPPPIVQMNSNSRVARPCSQRSSDFCEFDKKTRRIMRVIGDFLIWRDRRPLQLITSFPIAVIGKINRSESGRRTKPLAS